MERKPEVPRIPSPTAIVRRIGRAEGRVGSPSQFNLFAPCQLLVEIQHAVRTAAAQPRKNCACKRPCWAGQQQGLAVSMVAS